MLNEFVSLVISGNKEHRKLMETTWLVKGKLPVVPIEVPVATTPTNTQDSAPGVCRWLLVCLCVRARVCVCVCACVRVCFSAVFAFVIFIATYRVTVCISSGV